MAAPRLERRRFTRRVTGPGAEAAPPGSKEPPSKLSRRLRQPRDRRCAARHRQIVRPEEPAACLLVAMPVVTWVHDRTPNYTIAAAFGNVHGVYKPGNVKLSPIILKNSQQYVKDQLKLDSDLPINFVFHGGSGSSRAEIREAIEYGAIKMNIDTDMQWAYWDGVRTYEAAKHDYLQGQIGNPTGEDKPNKNNYDPRKWLRAAEKSFVARLTGAFEDLNCINRNA